MHADLKQLNEAGTLPDILKWVTHADDGPPFLHVISQFSELNKVPATTKHLNSAEMIAAQSCGRVLQQLLDDAVYQPEHYLKVKWFGIYWNETVGYIPDAPVEPVSFPGSRAITWER